MSDKKIHGVNCTQIGYGLYDMMTEKDKAVVAFGMIPKHMIDLAMKMIREKIMEVLGTCEHIKVDEKGMSEIEHQISLAIYERANSLGKMVV